MEPLHTLLAASVGTSAMSLFSYIIALLQNRPFREPKNLAILIHRLYPYPDMSKAYKMGWCCHYLVGFFFAELYTSLWVHNGHHPDVQSGLVFGGMSGIAAILIWKFTLQIHPDPPSINFTRYAGHLFLAHLVFGVFAVFGSRLVPGKT